MVRKNVLLILSLSLILFTGCNSNKVSENTESTQVIEEEKITTIVGGSAVVTIDEEGNALEYINAEDLDKNTEDKKENIESNNSEISLTESVDVTESVGQTTSEENISENVVLETSMEYKVVVPDEEQMGFVVQEYVSGNKDEIPNQILQSLQGVGLISRDVTIKSFEIKDNKCTIDLSEEFLTNINSVGTTGEYMIMGCLVNSFIITYEDVEFVKITINNEGFSSGHAEYNDFLTKYE